MARFREDQVRRYSRHIALPEVGGVGQERLLAARVGVLGEGLAWRAALLYLAGAGVGSLTLAEGEEGARMAEELKDLNPDAAVSLGDPEAAPLLVAVDARPAASRDGTWILAEMGEEALAVRRVEGAAPPPSAPFCRDAAREVLLGALAALEAQRLILGLDAGAGWTLDAESLEPRGPAEATP